MISGPRWQYIVYSDHRLVFFWRTWLNSPWKSLNGQHKGTIFQVTHLKLDAESLCQKRLAHLIDSAKLTAFRSRLQTTDWSLSITLTLPMIPTAHSLVLLITENYIISHFHLNLYTLNLGILLNPGFQKVSLYPVTGRILKTNPTESNKSRYNKYQNRYNFLIRVARKKYFHDLTWGRLGQLLSRSFLKRNLNNISVIWKTVVPVSVQTLHV